MTLRKLTPFDRRRQCPITDKPSSVPVSGQGIIPQPHTRGPMYYGAVTVDGRSGYQWYQSIEAYLLWRAGSSWRPISDRYNPERWYYLDGLRLLHDAYAGRVSRSS